MPDFDGLFAVTAPPLELVMRGTLTFLALVVLMRLVGQRESGGLGLTDLLVVVLVADAASAGLTGDSESIGDGLLLVLTVLFWSVALDAAAYRWPAFARLVKARPRPLIRDGQLNRAALRREFMTHEELMAQLRLHGIDDTAIVRRAYIEPNGMISVLTDDEDPTEEPDKPLMP